MFYPAPRTLDPDLTRRWLVDFIRDEIVRRRGFKKVVIGLSGGVDSSLVAYLAVEALGDHFIMYASDYPHWDFDDPRQVFGFQLTAEQRAKVFRDNAKALYGL